MKIPQITLRRGDKIKVNISDGKGSVRNVWVYGSSMVTAKDYVGANKNKRTRTVLGAIQRNGEPSRPEARRNAVQKPWRNR